MTTSDISGMSPAFAGQYCSIASLSQNATRDHLRDDEDLPRDGPTMLLVCDLKGRGESEEDGGEEGDGEGEDEDAPVRYGRE